MKKEINYLIVVDMQNDFVKNEPFATKEAQKIVPYIKELIKQYQSKYYPVIFTRDTHYRGISTIETSSLPKHCIKDTPGWCIIDEFQEEASKVINKSTYGYRSWGDEIHEEEQYKELNSITLVGVCTDICIISNALILRSLYPYTSIIVDAAGCAGTTPENHKKALDIMKQNSIEIINKGGIE